MAHTHQVPVVVGVGDIKNASLKAEGAIEPLDLMVKAIESALKDTGLFACDLLAFQSAIDSISVVANWTWPYNDIPQRIANRLQCEATYLCESEHGGNSPAKLFDEAARRISLGEARVAAVTGGEALASSASRLSPYYLVAALRATGNFPPKGWTHLDDTTSILEKRRPQDLGTQHGLYHPTQIYALYEVGFRAHRGQALPDNHQESSQLYAQFSAVAAKNKNSWRYGNPPYTAEAIGTISKKNRMICTPYPLLMNAFNTVNMAAACIITSTEFARELGIPESRWIYALGGAGRDDHEHVWKRPSFYSSRSLSQSLDAALEASMLTPKEVDLFDFYSCFPIVPKLASSHLGLPITSSLKPVTLLGGLTSFGGAGNNYSLHVSITEMVRQLRQGRGENGLVLANGGVLTHHHAICLSRVPRKDRLPYPKEPGRLAYVGDEYPPIAEQADGVGVIETYTVQYNRDGSPQIGFIVGRLREDGRRFIANSSDEATLKALATKTNEQVGREGWVSYDRTTARNNFSLGSKGNL
ncbi:hypothetical protein BDW75DRAFT_250193 [Aspergillus navahoensis]